MSATILGPSSAPDKPTLAELEEWYYSLPLAIRGYPPDTGWSMTDARDADARARSRRCILIGRLARVMDCSPAEAVELIAEIALNAQGGES